MCRPSAERLEPILCLRSANRTTRPRRASDCGVAGERTKVMRVGTLPSSAAYRAGFASKWFRTKVGVRVCSGGGSARWKAFPAVSRGLIVQGGGFQSWSRYASGFGSGLEPGGTYRRSLPYKLRAYRRRSVCRMPVNDDEHQPPCSRNQTAEKLTDRHRFAVPSITAKRNSPRGLIAEIMFKPERAPVERTIGVLSFTAQVVPAAGHLQSTSLPRRVLQGRGSPGTPPSATSRRSRHAASPRSDVLSASPSGR